MLFGLFGSSQPKETGPSASSAPSSSSSTPPPPPPHDQLLTDAEAEQQQMAFEPEGLAKVTSTNAPSENDAVADNTGLKQDGQSDALVSESVQRQWEEFKAQPGTQEITRELSNFPIYIGLGAVPGAMGAGWLMKRSNRTPSTAVTAIAVLCEWPVSCAMFLCECVDAVVCVGGD